MSPSSIRVLLVEDSAADALLLRHTLAEANGQSFELTHVELMSEAIRCLRHETFNAVLLDLSLPDSRGLDTLAQANQIAPHLPIIVMTGLDDEATALEAVRQGAQDFLIKGRVDARLLTRAIRYAMERKQAEQELKALNETLEQRVIERTATATHRANQLQALAAELTQAEHRERRRLALVLHDHLQQLLYAARLNLDTLRHRPAKKEDMQETIDQIDALLGECIAESRSLTVQLCPPVLHEAGLSAAIEWLGRHMEQTCGLRVKVEVDPRAEPDSEELRIVLFESARELLFNVVKHAETGRARISLMPVSDGQLCLVVADEGAGFVPTKSVADKATDSGFGLFSIRERLELLGGCMELESAPGRGARVAIFAPCNLNPDVPRPERRSHPRPTSVSTLG